MKSPISSATNTLFVILSACVLLLNCSGDDGAVGPKGDPGTNGLDGNANVIYSDWVYGKLFTDSVSDNSRVYVTHLSAPQITVDVLNKGTVFVYMNYGAGAMQLPYASYAGDKASTINFWIKLGKIIPYRFTHDNTNSVKLSTVMQYRYIILPGNNSANPKGRIAGPDFSNYEEVCKFYGIPL